MVQVRDGEWRDSHDGTGDKGEGEPHPEFPICVEDDRVLTQSKAKTTTLGLGKKNGFPFSRVDDLGLCLADSTNQAHEGSGPSLC